MVETYTRPIKETYDPIEIVRGKRGFFVWGWKDFERPLIYWVKKYKSVKIVDEDF